MSKTVGQSTPAEIITELGGGTEIVIHDRSNDPDVREKGVEDLKAAGISGNWKRIKRKP